MSVSHRLTRECLLVLILISGGIFCGSTSALAQQESVKPEATSTFRDIAPTPFVSIDSKELQLSTLSEIEPLLQSDQKEIDRLIAEGEGHFQQKNWMEARSHFEKAVRHYPNNQELQAHLNTARYHFEVAYRYNDSSFCRYLSESTFNEILSLYDEVLVNIQSYHVESPQWSELFFYGMDCLEAALTEPAFLKKNQVSTEKYQNVLTYYSALRGYCQRWKIESSADLRAAMLKVAEQMYQQTGVSTSSTVMEFVCGIVGSLDSYSSYLTLNQINDIYSLIDGQFVGLGVEIQMNTLPLFIERVIPGSPAQKAGVQNGDQILTIDDIDVTQFQTTEQAGNLLQGKEGSQVRLTVQSPNQEVKQIVVTRRRFDIPSVEDIHVINTEESRDRIGYLKIACFQKSTAAEMARAIQTLDQQGMQCLIIDLRKNPGGLLQEAIEVTNLFINQGVIVKTKGRSSEKPYYAQQRPVWQKPLILLIDENSASAAEIFAGAIRDNHRGRLIGSRSYGKGTVQAIIQLSGTNGHAPVAGLRITTEKFYSPKGYAYSGLGVEPDIVIAQNETPMNRQSSNPYSVAKPVNEEQETKSHSALSSLATRSKNLNWTPISHPALSQAETLHAVSTAQPVLTSPDHADAGDVSAPLTAANAEAQPRTDAVQDTCLVRAVEEAQSLIKNGLF